MAGVAVRDRGAHASVVLDDVQGVIRFGHGHLAEARFVLLRVRDRGAARAWLAAAPVTSAVDASPRPATALQVALTAAGLRALGVADRVVGALGAEFLAGIASDASRSRRLGDTGSSAPSEWQWGVGEREPHALLMLYAGGDGIDRHVEETLAACGGGFDVLQSLATATLDRDEPFGFADGISQPEPDWLRERAARDVTRDAYGNVVCLGEFLLGYPDEYGQYADRPLVDPREDPTGLLPAAEDDPAQRDFARNGSYLVLRSLRQDVRGFWRFVDRAAGGDAALRTRIATTMVGRTRAGVPLVDDRSRVVGTDPRAAKVDRNDFTFDDDPDGVRCPLGAHIRRTNPRNGDLPPGDAGLVARGLRMLGFDGAALAHDHVASTRFHRILRRGRKYGAPLSIDEALASPVDDDDRGIHFVSIGASIARQFEFVQGAWIEGAKFAGLSDEQDPLLGRRTRQPDGAATDRFSCPETIGPDRRVDGLPEFVTVAGGAYFFLPGLRALRYLATAPGDAPPVITNVSCRQPSACTGSPVLDLIADASMTLIRLERRIDPFVRPVLDALLKGPTERAVTALVNLQRRMDGEGQGMMIAEERAIPDEEAHVDSIVASFHEQMTGLWKAGGFERGGNTKTQGIVRAEFIVHDGLPEPLRRGIYATPRRYPAWVRFSGPGPYITPDIDDVGFMSISIKLMDVPGQKLMGDERHTLDLFAVSTATFVTADTASNADLQRWSVKNAALFHFVNAFTPHLSDFVMQGLYTKTQTSVFEAPYFSCVPYLMGAGQAMVYSVWPTTTKRTPIPNLPFRPPDDYLRRAMVAALAAGDVDLEFRIQLQADPFLMPIENAAVLWPVSKSPRVPVATLHIPRQTFDSAAQMDFAKRLSFNPWHTIAEHRPLGNQSRARRRMYAELSAFRQRMNQVAHVEPDGSERFD